MCLEGKSTDSKQTVLAGIFGIQCLKCKQLYTSKQWNDLETTTMGGSSESSDDGYLVHKFELASYVDKIPEFFRDGVRVNLGGVLTPISEALERYPAVMGVPIKWLGSQQDYERLGRAMGLAPAAVPESKTAETVEHLDDGCVRVGGIKYAPVLGHGMAKTLAENYSYAELGRALAQRMRQISTPGFFAPFEATDYIAERLGYERKGKLDAHDHLQQAVAALSESSVARDSPLHALIEQLAARVVPAAPDKRLGEIPLDLVAVQVLLQHVDERTRPYASHDRSSWDPMVKTLVSRLYERVIGKPDVEPLPPVASEPPLKLAQRLAAFVAERAALDKACKEFDESSPKTNWARVAFISAVDYGTRKASGHYSAPMDGWAETGTQRAKYMEEGFRLSCDLVAPAKMSGDPQYLCVFEF